jgi:large subunit ribosomal protein L21
MYAILQHGGHQYRVASGDRILVDRIPVEVGSTVRLESVLLLGDGTETEVAKGSPVEASVTATVIAHRRGRKIRVFTYKPKKRHRRTLGYRSQLTELRIDEVGRGKPASKPKAVAPKRAEVVATEESPKSERPAAKADAVEAGVIAAEVAVEAEAVAEATEATEADVAAAELAVEAAKPAVPKRTRTPKPKKEPGDGA